MTSYSKTEYKKYLNILEVNVTDSLDTIKSAYRKLVAKYHPDKQTDDVAKELANEKLKMVNQAYEYLCKYYDTYSSGQSTDYENYTQEETTYNSNYSYEDSSEEYQEDNYEYNDNNFEDDYDDEYTYDEPYEQENNYNQQNLYTQDANGCSITITVIVLFIVACIIVAIITSSDNNHDKNISNDQRLNQYSYNKDNNADNTIQEQERKNAENAQRRLEQETQTVVQNLTPEQQTAKFEKDMATYLNSEINSFSYYNSSPDYILKNKTFSGIAYCKLNGNSNYKWEYLGGDLDDASGHNLGREISSFLLGSPIRLRQDDNYDYDYKMLIKHTSAGTTVKVLKIYHYTEADKEMNKKNSFASNQTTQPAIQNTKKISPQTNKTPTPKINVEKEIKENDAYLFE